MLKVAFKICRNEFRANAPQAPWLVGEGTPLRIPTHIHGPMFIIFSTDDQHTLENGAIVRSLILYLVCL